ncbi:hypothetical protein ACB098_12G164700 [Castanea mollissima]
MNLLFLSLGFHQNLLEKASILLQILTSTLNADKVQLGMAWVTELMSVHLPTHERQWLLQLVNLDSSFSSRNLKSFDGDLDRNSGAPRYIASFLSFFICRCCLIALQILPEVCLE